MDAARGRAPIAELAFAILADPNVAFASSSLIRLEVLPKPTRNKNAPEVSFYEDYFASVHTWVPVTEGLVQQALEEASALGLSALDALHVVMAAAAGADEFITAEGPDKPMHQTKLVKVRSIRPAS